MQKLFAAGKIKTFTRSMIVHALDKGLADFDLSVVTPCPSGRTTVLTKHEPAVSPAGSYSPLVEDKINEPY